MPTGFLELVLLGINGVIGSGIFLLLGKATAMQLTRGLGALAAGVPLYFLMKSFNPKPAIPADPSLQEVQP